MKLINIRKDKLLLPKYIIDCISNIKWIDSDDEKITFYPNDLVVIYYGTRGSTSYSSYKHIIHGANTTNHQLFSPKLPTNILYLQDGGSGILEISNVVVGICFSKGVDPFKKKNEDKVQEIIKSVILLITHYHLDHLDFGIPFGGLFHAPTIYKYIIGYGKPRDRFKETFKHPSFPVDFREIKSHYNFNDIDDIRSIIIIYLPNGEFKMMDVSDFDDLISDKNPQIRHKNVSYNLDSCIPVKCWETNHPDPTISYRYENYNNDGSLQNSLVTLTDHELIREDAKNVYFQRHLQNTNFLYIDGQYSKADYMSGFGHGRVEIIAEIVKEFDLKNVAIGHHNPTRTDDEIGKMIKNANDIRKLIGGSDDIKIFGASDRMSIVIPDPIRGRKGIVVGRMSLEKGEPIKDLIGEQNTVVENYKNFDLTETYKIEDRTSKD